MRQAVAPILGSSNPADSSTRTSMVSLCARGCHPRTRTGFPKITHRPSVIRVLGTVGYQGQKKTIYKWQPRVVDSSQGRSKTHLNDFDHESFTCMRHQR